MMVRDSVLSQAVSSTETLKLIRDGGIGLTVWGLTLNDLVGIVTIAYIVIKAGIEVLKYMDSRRA